MLPFAFITFYSGRPWFMWSLENILLTKCISHRSITTCLTTQIWKTTCVVKLKYCYYQYIQCYFFFKVCQKEKKNAPSLLPVTSVQSRMLFKDHIYIEKRGNVYTLCIPNIITLQVDFKIKKERNSTYRYNHLETLTS